MATRGKKGKKKRKHQTTLNTLTQISNSKFNMRLLSPVANFQVLKAQFYSI